MNPFQGRFLGQVRLVSRSLGRGGGGGGGGHGGGGFGGGGFHGGGGFAPSGFHGGFTSPLHPALHPGAAEHVAHHVHHHFHHDVDVVNGEDYEEYYNGPCPPGEVLGDDGVTCVPWRPGLFAHRLFPGRF